MNFKANVLSATMVAATLATATLAVSPAQAATLNGTLNISSTIGGGVNVTNSQIDFFGPLGITLSGVNASTGSFASALPAVIVKDLTLPTPQNPEKNNFISGALFAFPSIFTFSLDTFNFVGSAVQNSATFTGFFRNGFDLTPGFGTFTSQNNGSDPSSYSISITTGTRAVPTPALLPGLIALGVGVLRKRKAEAAEKVGVDA